MLRPGTSDYQDGDQDGTRPRVRRFFFTTFRLGTGTTPGRYVLVPAATRTLRPGTGRVAGQLVGQLAGLPAGQLAGQLAAGRPGRPNLGRNDPGTVPTGCKAVICE